MGILVPDGGEVRWGGETVGDRQRRRFGYMPEERGLYKPRSVREHLVYLARLHGLGRPDAGERVDRWIDRLGLGERARSKVEELSPGNQQRVQLGAALVHGTELLVLDEPFSGLDPIGVDVMSEVVRDQAGEGVAVLFSSHQLYLVEDLWDEVVIVHRGRVVLAGEVDELEHRGQGMVVVDLDAGVDARAVLAAAERVAPLTHFSRELPLLSELFRQAVAG